MSGMPAKATILIVDDEPDAVRYLDMVLRDDGYETRSAADGEQALALARRERPDLIALDISMPKASGTRFYRQLKDDPALAAVPVVIVTGVTGYGGDAFGYRKFLEGRSTPPPEAFFPKPIDRESFLAAVRRLLGRAAPDPAAHE